MHENPEKRDEATAVDRLVASATAADFARAMQSLAGDKLLSHDRIFHVIVQYIDSALLDHRTTRLELARRVAVLLGTVRLTHALRTELAAAAKSWPAEIRNVLVLLLPPADRRALFQPVTRDAQVTPECLNDREEQGIIQGPSAEENVSDVKTTTSLTSPDLGEYLGEFVTVLLLGVQNSQDANMALLRNAGYSPFVVESFQELTLVLKVRDDVCGIVLDESFISILSDSEVKLTLCAIGEYSSFVWVRIFCGSLSLSWQDARSCLREKRFDRDDLPSHLVLFAESRDLKQRELGDLSRARSVLNSTSNVKLNVKGMRDSAAHILASSRAQAPQSDSSLSGQISLGIELITTGKSGATVAFVEQSGSTAPIIVKIGAKSEILEEARRFKQYIKSWDSTLDPVLHFHQDTGLIAFRTIREGVDSMTPARSLQGRLEALWNSQYLAPSAQDIDDEARSLSHCTRQVAEALCTLNARPALNPSDYFFVNPSETPFGRLESTGVDWGFADSVRELRREGRLRFEKKQKCATVHGDVHLDNILVTSVGAPYLIDYAASGPGHPCIDLVRLELSLMLGHFRLMSDIQEFSQLFLDIHLGALTDSQILSRYPRICLCPVNVVCVNGAMAARKYAIQAAMSYGGGQKDYAATKLLTAWQSMAMHNRQTALCRAAIEVIASNVA